MIINTTIHKDDVLICPAQFNTIGKDSFKIIKDLNPGKLITVNYVYFEHLNLTGKCIGQSRLDGNFMFVICNNRRYLNNNESSFNRTSQ